MPNNVGQHFALLYDDLDAAVAEAADAGPEGERPVGGGGDRRQQAFIIDPWGNAIELHQPRLSQAR